MFQHVTDGIFEGAHDVWHYRDIHEGGIYMRVGIRGFYIWEGIRVIFMMEGIIMREGIRGL